MSAPRAASEDRAFWGANLLVSGAALGVLAWILVIRRGSADAGLDLRFLPAVNAALNAISATFLIAGWTAIRRRAVRTHRACMVAAFSASTLFLASYLAYHWVHGDTRFVGPPLARTLYLVILASHVILSAFVVPLALAAFWFAFRRRFATHRRITRWALPIWLYVSVTGVVIFFFLRTSTPAVP